jgi:hypothetical protein
MRAIYKIFGLVFCLMLFSPLSIGVQSSPSDTVQVLFNVAGWPVVVTNESTNVEEDSAILNGFLVSDGGIVCQYAFDYSTVSGEPYAFSTVWAGAINSPQVFGQGVALLIKGELYYFRAKAKNLNGTSNGNEKTFLTKPDPPTNFHAVRDLLATQINLTWTMGAGADKIVVVRKIGAYPADRTDGVTVYNGTSSSHNDGTVVAGNHYYYRAWSYCSEGGLFRFSDDYDEANCLALIPTIFDIKNIVIVDNVIPALEINVDVENTGALATDITVTWTLTREDTGVILDTGADTFAVPAFSTVVYTVYPITTYVGQVRITFTGASASAFSIFNTASPPTGGGGVVTPPKPPSVPSVPPSVPSAVAGFELPCLLFIFVIIILFIFFIIFWKRRKKKEEK